MLVFQEMAPTERLRKDKFRRLIQEPEIKIQDKQEAVPEQQPMKHPEIEVLRRHKEASSCLDRSYDKVPVECP